MIRKFLLIISILLPLLSSCELKKELMGDVENPLIPELPENSGLLDLELIVEKEEEIPLTKGSDNEELLADEFSISVFNSDGELERKYESFKQLKEEGGLLLLPGFYTVRAEKGEDIKAGFDKPFYLGEDTFSIVDQEVRPVQVRCRLHNKKVTFRYSEDFLSQFNNDFVIVVDNGLGVLSFDKKEERGIFLQNTNKLRFTVYATTIEGEQLVYGYDISKNPELKEHNNILVELGFVENKPVDPENPPVDPEEPEDPGDNKPDLPVRKPYISVDISLIEKDFIIEIPSEIIGGGGEIPGGGDKPVTPDGGGEDPSKPDVNPDAQSPKITGTINGQSFDVNTPQTITASTKSVVINLFAPTGLSELKVDVSIGTFIKLPLDLLDKSSVDEINTILSAMGKKLEVPSKGDKGNLKFDISAFLSMLDTTNSFAVTMKDANGKSASATITLNKK